MSSTALQRVSHPHKALLLDAWIEDAYLLPELNGGISLHPFPDLVRPVGKTYGLHGFGKGLDVTVLFVPIRLTTAMEDLEGSVELRHHLELVHDLFLPPEVFDWPAFLLSFFAALLLAFLFSALFLASAKSSR